MNNNSQLLFGYTFEIREIYGSNDEDDVRDNVLQTFLARIPFLIGPYSSETSYLASILTRTFRQNAVSYSAVFSDFDSRAMLRTVPSNFYRVQALLDLMERLEWNYLAVISSYGHDGERDAKNFISRLSSIGVCLGEHVDFPRQSSKDNSSFHNAVTAIYKDQRIRAIILFTINDDSRRIMMALKENKLEHFYRIICAFGCTNSMEVVEDIEDVALGTISLDIHYKREYGFENYFLSRTPKTNNDAWFIKFWEKVFSCKVTDENMNIIDGSGLPPCTGDEKLEEGKGYYPLTPVHTVIDGSDSHFRSLCSEHCHPEYVRVRDRNTLKSQCCWSCQKYPPNNININDTCTPCDRTEMAVGSTCMELPKRYLDISTNPSDPFHGTILFLSIVGLSLTLFVVVLFIKFNESRIVRAYGRDLCYMILTGVAILFISPVLALGKSLMKQFVTLLLNQNR